MKIPVFDRRRLIEISGIIAVTTALIGISRLETRLYNLSETIARDFTMLASILYYGIINLNVFLAILLSMLVVRNIAKLLVDRRRGVFGSRLRTKLVGVLIVFSLVPTVLVFYVSTRFITKSFDEWFGGRVKETTQQTRDAGAQIYLQDQRRLEGIAKVASSRIKLPLESRVISKSHPSIDYELPGFELEYGIQSIRIYDSSGTLINRESLIAASRDEGKQGFPAAIDMLSRFTSQPLMVSASTVSVENGKDVIRAAVPLRLNSGRMVAIVMVEERFDVPVLANIQTILDGISALKPGAQLVRVSYLILVTVMTLLIIFAAVWFGFYVAKAITGPLQILAEATKEVALGNYTINLQNYTEDETGQLTKAFNSMTQDLSRHKYEVESARTRLEESNREMDKRRRYMEIVFENIASGVIAVDSKGRITAFNDAALVMLGLNESSPIGKRILDVLGKQLYESLWEKIDVGSESLAREVDLRDHGIDATVYIAASHIETESGDFQGTVLVLDDATDRIRMQRATAWREVAKRIAHEIKNPITPIRLSAERLLRRFSNRFSGEDRDVFEKCVESILVQVDTLRGLVNEFSKFSRLPTVQPRPANLNAIVSSAVEVFRQGYPQINFVETYPTLPELQLDPEQFNRVVVNLVSNAVDAVLSCGRAGVIRIATRYEPSIDADVLEIADNGSGIPEAIKDRVFEPYFSTKESGTGLGLAMVNQIVNDHGGYVRIASSDANGTLFRIELPVSGKVKV
jgi:two-component system nitrogen regulation sensor histidine kinase NtrY